MANTYKCVITVEGIKEYIGDSKIVAFDYETAPDLPYLTEAKAALDPARAHLVGCSFSVSEGTGIYVPIAHQEGQNIHTREFLSFLKELLEKDRKSVV